MILDGLTNDECISLLEKIKEEYNITSDIEEKKYTNIHDQTDICFMLSKKALPKYYVYEYNPKKTLDPETITFLESLNMKQYEKIYENNDIKKWNNIEYLSSKINDILNIIFNKFDTLKLYQDNINNDINNLVKEIRTKDIKDSKNIPIFDLTTRYKCCNCISIVLYYQEWTGGWDNLDRLLNTYLYSMKKTLDIVSNNLDTFIVRYYIHTSVFDAIQMNDEDNFRELEIKGLCNEIIKYLLKHRQSEVFIYSCEKIIGDFVTSNLSKIRINRFLQDDVNILISREADGILSISDCNNIKLFMEDNKKILITYNFANSFNLGFLLQNRRYHNNLRAFNNLEDFVYERTFTKQQNIDFLAGIFSSKLKFNLEYIWNTVKEFNKIFILFLFMSYSYDYYEDLNKIIHEKNIKCNNFNQSFDEIILNNLLKPINTENLSKYCVLIDKDALGFSKEETFVLTYTSPYNNEKIVHKINTEDIKCEKKILISCIDVSLKNFNENLYSNLPILLINSPCSYNDHKSYDELYPTSILLSEDYGLKRKSNLNKK